MHGWRHGQVRISHQLTHGLLRIWRCLPRCRKIETLDIKESNKKSGAGCAARKRPASKGLAALHWIESYFQHIGAVGRRD